MTRCFCVHGHGGAKDGYVFQTVYWQHFWSQLVVCCSVARHVALLRSLILLLGVQHGGVAHGIVRQSINQPWKLVNIVFVVSSIAVVPFGVDLPQMACLLCFPRTLLSCAVGAQSFCPSETPQKFAASPSLLARLFSASHWQPRHCRDNSRHR